MTTENARWEWTAAVVGVFLLALMATDASAQARRYEGIHPDWLWVPGFDSSRVDDCLGHCGAGCGSAFAICGDRHTLVRRIDPPLSSETFANQRECRLIDFVPADWPGGYLDGEWYTFSATRYTARGEWIFEGQWDSLCEWHDEQCRRSGGCSNPRTYWAHVMALVEAIPCNARDRNWSYEENFYRWQFTEPWSTGLSCQVWVGSTSG